MAEENEVSGFFDDADDSDTVCSKSLVPLRPYVVLTYDTDFAGWEVASSANTYRGAAIHAEALRQAGDADGVAIAAICWQTIEPTKNYGEKQARRQAGLQGRQPV